MAAQNLFNFAKFNSKAAQLNLIVATPAELKLAVVSKADHVPCPVNSLCPTIRQGQSLKFFRCEFWSIPVSTSDALPGDCKLPECPNWCEQARPFKDINPGVRDGPSDRNDRPRICDKADR